jgi:sugar phosphate isomerase/epimerase
MKTDRREFLKQVGAGANVLAWSGIAAACAAGGDDNAAAGGAIESIGVQLYTVRDRMAQDFEGTLSEVAGIGYREVEFAGYFDREPRQVRAILDRLGLRSPAAHIAFESIDDGWDAVLDAAAEIGHQWVIVAWLNASQRESVDALRRTADAFNRAGQLAMERGVRFAYHNHNFEFTPMGDVLPFDVLLESCEPANVDFEMDIYWAVTGGADPLAYFERWPGRFPMVHVKDVSAGGAMVDVGQGTIDWPRVLGQHGQAGIRHYFVEHDEPADALASLRTSFAYMQTLRL